MGGTTYIQEFLRQAARTPGAPAVRDSNGGITYAELAQRSAFLAEILRNCAQKNKAHAGVLKTAAETNPDRSHEEGRTAVAVLLPRTLEIMVAAIAAMRSGGAYVPMDPAYPEERLRYMLQDSGAGILVTTRELLEQKFPSDAPKAILIEELEFSRTGRETVPDAAGDAVLTPDSPSYLLYTSGTTGRPKGVLHTQRSLLAMATQKHECGYDSTGVVAGFTFIASAFMMFPPLLTGGSCDIVPDSAKADMNSLHDYVTAKGIHQLFLPASLAASMAEEFDMDGVTIFSAGEKLRSFTPKGGCRIINTYGSTEGGGVLVWPVHNDEIDIPLGLPFPGITARIVDENMQDAAQGEAGELIYSGDIMAERYLNLDELTAAKWFVADGRRWYRTGDRMKKDPQGRYHYLGRTDNMVKIRGFRVETGEVENCIRAAEPRITEAVVVLRSIHGIDHLCCYFTSADCIDTAELEASIARRLAEYMIPDIWTRLQDFPRNANGKIVRGALPEPQLRQDAFSALYSEVEMRVEEAARSVLGIDIPVDIDASFLDLGGDSIRAMKLSAMLCEQGIRVSGAQILRTKILREIARKADVAYERLWTPAQYSEVRHRFASRGEKILRVLPLTPEQDDLLYGEILFPDSGEGRSVYVLAVDERISEDELSKAVQGASEQFEAIRAAVVYQGVSVFQQVITDRKVPCSVCDLSKEDDSIAALLNLCERIKAVPSDPEQSPALEIVFARDGSSGNLVFKVMQVCLGLGGVRRAIALVLKQLARMHPQDGQLRDWLELMESAVEGEGGSSERKFGRRAIRKDSYEEMAVYSEHPGKKKVVFVHTGNSGSDAYYALADRISDACSFSVIEPYNLYNPAEAIDGIRGIAAKYIEILKRWQSEGPYFLGGWCYGGVVAHEMACQLQDRGEKVERLVMLDSHAVTDPEARRLFTEMTSQTRREYFETSPLFADLRNQGLLESVVANSRRVARNLAMHEPGIFEGPVTYFKPQVTPAGLNGESLRYWQEMMKCKAGGYELFCKNITVIPTPHEHDLMMDAESLEITVPEILKCINE